METVAKNKGKKVNTHFIHHLSKLKAGKVARKSFFFPDQYERYLMLTDNYP